MSDSPKRIHVVINPAAGGDEPILNTLNDVFHAHGVDWDVSITKAFGDATRLARQAAHDGFDIVAGYGGDGTQHEIANGVLDTDVVMGVLPGGTGNNFARELGTPLDLRGATELLAASDRVRRVDVIDSGESVFILRLLAGLEPEQQTSREDKDRWGKLAYVVNTIRQTQETAEADFHITMDGETAEMRAMVLYVVNAATNDAGVNVVGERSSIDDGLMDTFVLNAHDLQTLAALSGRVLNLDTEGADEYFHQGREMRIEAEPDQAVWADGELIGRTPITLKVLPGALPVLVP
jgi:YegS/Rv2252/BmrU family lipid kinase